MGNIYYEQKKYTTAIKVRALNARVTLWAPHHPVTSSRPP